MTVKFSCEECGLRRTEVEVVDREPDQDIHAWMQQLIAAIAGRHTALSPACRAREITEVMIPSTGRAIIGGPLIQ